MFFFLPSYASVLLAKYYFSSVLKSNGILSSAEIDGEVDFSHLYLASRVLLPFSSIKAEGFLSALRYVNRLLIHVSLASRILLPFIIILVRVFFPALEYVNRLLTHEYISLAGYFSKKVLFSAEICEEVDCPHLYLPIRVLLSFSIT